MLVGSTIQFVGRRRAAIRCAVAAIALALTSAGRQSAAGPAHGETLELAPANAPERPPAADKPTSPSPAATVAFADDSAKTVLAEALERPGSLSCRNMTIESALFTISDTWKVNVVTGKQLEGIVNCVFEDTPLREILDAILLANGYSYRAIGDSLVVQASSDVGSANPLFRSMSLPIQHSNIDEVVEGAKMLISSNGQVKSLPSARTVLVIDYADRVESVAALVKHMEAAAAGLAGAAGAQGPHRLEVAYFHTHFIPVASAQQPLLAVLSPLGRVAMMPAENRLLVVDYAANIDMARKVLERVDRPRPQVRITALIYDLSLQDVEQLGLNWGSAGKGNSLDADGVANQALAFESTTVAPFATPNGTVATPIVTGQAGGALTVRSLTDNFDITTVLQLLQSANDARLLANPNVTVMDNERAEWKSVTEIPYQQITETQQGGNIGTTAFKEAGITLVVQPTIAGDGTIEMLVEPEFSRLAGFTPQGDQPIIDTRKATTRVRIANGQTLVLSGLRQRSDTGDFNGIPFLKDVKYLGPLFRSRNTNVRESELIVFIMPEIVGYDDQSTCRQYQALETLDCRLAQIPAAEGCPPLGGDPCSGGLIPLPSIDGPHDPAAAGEPRQPSDAAAAQPIAAPPAPSPMRPMYEARFRANGRTDLDRHIPGGATPPPATKQKSTWQRMFGS